MMRFNKLFAAFLFVSVSAWAQHRGGGAHSFSGPHISSGPRVTSGARGFSGNRVGSTPYTHRAGGGSFARGGYGYTGRYANHDRFRYHRQVPYLWPLFPNYYDPFLFGDSGYNSIPDYNSGYVDPNAYGAPADGPPPGPDPQTEELAAQVQQLRDQLSATQQQGIRVPMAPPQEAPSTVPAVPITVVLKDGQHLQVQNYAVMNQTLWDFTSQPVKKIPLENIDLAASRRLSAASGADFPNLALSSGSGQ